LRQWLQVRQALLLVGLLKLQVRRWLILVSELWLRASLHTRQG
jgi:hypothetical protein